jgi:hypothetical protein
MDFTRLKERRAVQVEPLPAAMVAGSEDTCDLRAGRCTAKLLDLFSMETPAKLRSERRRAPRATTETGAGRRPRQAGANVCRCAVRRASCPAAGAKNLRRAAAEVVGRASAYNALEHVDLAMLLGPSLSRFKFLIKNSMMDPLFTRVIAPPRTLVVIPFSLVVPMSKPVLLDRFGPLLTVRIFVLNIITIIMFIWMLARPKRLIRRRPFLDAACAGNNLLR